MTKRKIVDGMSVQCKYCSATFMCDDDLSAHESEDHGDNLEDYELSGGMFRLKNDE